MKYLANYKWRSIINIIVYGYTLPPPRSDPGHTTILTIVEMTYLLHDSFITNVHGLCAFYKIFEASFDIKFQMTPGHLENTIMN